MASNIREEWKKSEKWLRCKGCPVHSGSCEYDICLSNIIANCNMWSSNFRSKKIWSKRSLFTQVIKTVSKLAPKRPATDLGFDRFEYKL